VALKMLGALNSTNSSVSGASKALSLLGYTSKLISTLLELNCAKTSTMTSVIEGLNGLYGQSLWARYAYRLVNGPGSMVDACLNDSWAYGSLPELPLSQTEYSEYPYSREAHPVVRSIEKTMPWSMAVYYPTEAVAYAGWMFPGLLHNGANETAVSSFRHKNNWYSSDHWSAASCAAWLWYTVADAIVQCERIYRIGAILEALKKQKSDSPQDALVSDLEGQLYSSKIVLVRSTLFLLPAFAWSFPDFGTNPKVGNNTINVLTWLENCVDYFTKVEEKGMFR
jgi:hypothetical protein